jgi:hypothetical protein
LGVLSTKSVLKRTEKAAVDRPRHFSTVRSSRPAVAALRRKIGMFRGTPATTHFQGRRARRRDDRTHGSVRRAGLMVREFTADEMMPGG